jgi:outer membrane protein TolC
VHQAKADLLTASLIPNASLYADYQLIPLQSADIKNQLGPPQADALVSVPIDWLLFGKRVAAMQAVALGIDVSNADYADLHRVQVGRTVDAFYEILANEKYLKLAEESLAELEQLKRLTDELAKNKKVGSLESDRIKLAVLEALLEKHDRGGRRDRGQSAKDRRIESTSVDQTSARPRHRTYVGRSDVDQTDARQDGALGTLTIASYPTLQTREHD